jgi:ADP-ribose pyrophosphatase YjhB (NUDIX family)
MRVTKKDIGGGNITDILFHTESYVFSYRVAGILISDGKVLLQKPKDDDSYAFPGGHVAFGETNAETLYREFREEIGVDISVGELKWVAEIFFPWDNKPCHQICLYYLINMVNKDQIKLDGKFAGIENFDGKEFNIEFCWIPIERINEINIYPTNAIELLKHFEDGVKHFIYKE